MTQAPQELAVALDGIEMTYGSGAAACQALSDVRLDVKVGEMLALMGPSGSGKSTLLSVIAGLLHPTGGTISVLGQALNGMTASQLAAFRLARIGFIFQGFNLFPALTAEENVAVALDLKGKPKAQAADLLDMVGLSDKRRNFPAQLSGGQKQRVAIARALAGDPPLILADEPTAALDSHNGHTIMSLIKTLVHQGRRTAVVVSHDPRIIDLADRVATISDGRIVSCG